MVARQRSDPPTVLYLGAQAGYEGAASRLGDKFRLVNVEANIEAVRRALGTAAALLDASMQVKLTDALFGAAPSLRIVSCATTGSDHIDKAAAARRGIEIRTLRENRDLLKSLTPAAELSWALLMACARKLPAALAHVREGFWERERFPGAMLNGKTLGIVGCGRIGQWMSRYGAAFGMKAIGYDPHLDAFPAGLESVTLRQLAEQSDFVTVHVHLSEETEGLIAASLFAQMKAGVIFINTSRAQVADEAALLAGLMSGHIGAAGLDVLAGEPQIAGNPLLEYAKSHDNLLITPHCGGFSPDAVRLVCAAAAAKIADVLGNRA